MKANELELTFASLPENVGIARMLIGAIGAQLDLSLNDIEELKVAMSEAVSNAIIHGYRNNPDGLVRVQLQIAPEALTIVVHDKGCGIADIEQAMQPAFSTDPERMGLGFVFMQSFMDKLRVDSAIDEGTTVTMIKYLNRAPSSH